MLCVLKTGLGMFFATDYIPHARAVVGCGGLPNGKAVYALCLRYHTTTSMSADQVNFSNVDIFPRRLYKISPR
jgi:uncharacterized protein (DUF885 family)